MRVSQRDDRCGVLQLRFSVETAEYPLQLHYIIYSYINLFSPESCLPKDSLLPLQTLSKYIFSFYSLIYPILRHPTRYAKPNAASTRLFTSNIFTFNATLGRISMHLYFHKPHISIKVCMCVICRCECKLTYISVCVKNN